MFGPNLSIDSFKKHVLYTDQVELVRSICLDTVKRRSNNRYVFWGDWLSFLILMRSVRQLCDLKFIIEDFSYKNKYIKTLSSHPSDVLWIFANTLPERVFKFTPVDSSIYFIYLKPLRNDYGLLNGLSEWMQGADPISKFEQDFQLL